VSLIFAGPFWGKKSDSAGRKPIFIIGLLGSAVGTTAMALTLAYGMELKAAGATAGLGLQYDNECVTVDLSVWRSYSSSTSVEPTTNIGFNVGLRGFAASTGTERYLRSCRK